MGEVTAETMAAAVAPRTLGVKVPGEPPARSVVIDREGWAWQRVSARWLRTGTVVAFMKPSDPPMLPWSHLLADYGPVELIHRAAPDAEDDT